MEPVFLRRAVSKDINCARTQLNEADHRLTQLLWCNRYYQLEPYDRTRVVVGEGDGGHLESGQELEASTGSSLGGRYINANWVRELHGGA